MNRLKIEKAFGLKWSTNLGLKILKILDENKMLAFEWLPKCNRLDGFKVK